MKIKYDLDGVQYKFYDFIQGVYLYKNKIRKNNVDTIHGFTFYVVLAFVLTFTFFIFSCLFMSNDANLFVFKMFTCVSTVLMLFILFSYLFFIVTFFYNKKKLSTGNIILNDDGITDVNEGMSIMFKWDNIDFIAVKDDMVVIMPKNDFLMITFLSNESNKFVKNAKKYNKDLFIVRLD